MNIIDFIDFYWFYWFLLILLIYWFFIDFLLIYWFLIINVTRAWPCEIYESGSPPWHVYGPLCALKEMGEGEGEGGGDEKCIYRTSALPEAAPMLTILPAYWDGG